MPVPTLAQLDPEGLEAYFTDVEQLRHLFETLVAAPALPKRLLIIHGVGGVGKSSLLRMFRLHCQKVSAPVALASGDEVKSAVEVLTRWADDLKVAKLKLPTLAKTVRHYRIIQAKVEEQARKAQELRDNAVGTLGKAAAKTIVETAVSAIPVVGPLISGLSGMSAEALVDWLGSFLKKPDIDLLLDPVKALTDDFLVDIARIAPKQRLVLMLDTFEQLTLLEDWARDLAQRLHPTVLLVVAGRAVPNWSRRWPGWLAQAEVQELRPMTNEIMRELVSRYYATMRGGKPDPAQVEAIIAFARGLPIVVTSAVQLWVQYGVEDFLAIKPQVMADLVDRLQEGVPHELVPVLEAAAAVRWFNKDILRAVTGLADVNTLYDELRRFPFTRPRVEGLALHDAVREIMDENLRIQDPARHRVLHEQAAVYFETRLAQTSDVEAERLELERLYHHICANEPAGIRLFQEYAEELTRHRLLNRLRILLTDTNTYPLEQDNSHLWREYYNARLMHLNLRPSDSEEIYQTISNNERAELKLRAYALCSLGLILSRVQRLKQSDAISILEQSLSLAPLDTYLAEGVMALAKVYRYQNNWEKIAAYNEQAIQFFKEQGDSYGLINAYTQQRAYHAGRGEWKEMLNIHKRGEEVLPALAEHSYFRAKFLGLSAWAWALMGCYAEGERNVRNGLEIARYLDDKDSVYDLYKNLGLLLTKQNRLAEATDYFYESLKIARTLGKDFQTKVAYVQGWRGVLLIRQGMRDEAEEILMESLAIREKFQLNPDIPALLVRLGELNETNYKWDTALRWYDLSLEKREVGQFNFLCEALVGKCRVKHAQGDYTAIPPLLSEAEQLAQQYEYNDLLASLRLTQGHIAWGGHLPEWGSGFEAALGYYQQALIYALRFNRFLSDEVLWGGGVCTPLRPIIPHCQERGEAGRQMLAALRDWWQTGTNDIGVSRSDTISPIPEGIPLLKAERLAREREPGDGSPQSTVLQQLELALV